MEALAVEERSIIDYYRLLYSPISHYYWRKKLTPINFQPSSQYQSFRWLGAMAQLVLEFSRAITVLS